MTVNTHLFKYIRYADLKTTTSSVKNKLSLQRKRVDKKQIT